MSDRVSPTKGNLLKLKKSLALAKVGYDLLDRKRNILIRETMSMVDDAKRLQETINESYYQAYIALQIANVKLGFVEDIANDIPIENGLSLSSRSIMGVEIPTVKLDAMPVANYYGFHRTNAELDEAYILFDKVKKLTAELAQVENSVYRMAEGIRKAQKRANALKNIIIPRFDSQIKFISSDLDEKEREEFSRLKVIKKIIEK